MNVGQPVVLGVSDFVAVFNQTLEFTFPSVLIVGELANLRVSRGRWLYFDLKDEESSLKFFGTVQQLPGPLEDGMMLQVRGAPRLHQLYGFSVQVQFMQPVGEGSIRKAGALLAAKLEAEGLFAEDRKREIPYPPQTIGLITSVESAAYRDFMKILAVRWSGVRVQLTDVQVQGEPAVAQVVQAIEYFNSHDTGAEVLVITRGGGSADDLAVFSTEQVTRAVAASRIPTIVAIGHEVDESLAELAADLRASTPSNAAELLVPDRGAVDGQLLAVEDTLRQAALGLVAREHEALAATAERMQYILGTVVDRSRQALSEAERLLLLLDPTAVLKRGYGIVQGQFGVVRHADPALVGQSLNIRLQDGSLNVVVNEVTEDRTE